MKKSICILATLMVALATSAARAQDIQTQTLC